jgi:hypothetical protein
MNRRHLNSLAALIAEALTLSQAASRRNLRAHTQEQLCRMMSTRLFDADALITQILRDDRAIWGQYIDDYQSYSAMMAQQSDSLTAQESQLAKSARTERGRHDEFDYERKFHLYTPNVRDL